MYSLVDSGINEQVVIDSTSSPNYDSWQTNVNNEVCVGLGFQGLNGLTTNNYVILFLVYIRTWQ